MVNLLRPEAVYLLPGTGISLDPLTRSFMESRFGQAFDDVRIHTGPWADAAARALRARAFTFGHDIFFAQGQYAPHRSAGRRLLAHELVHIVQQRGVPGAPDGCVGVGDPRDPLETEAELVAEQVCGTGPISPIHADKLPTLRRVIQFDASSAVMTVDPGVKNAKAVVDVVKQRSGPVAFARLVPGTNIAKAAAGGGPNDIIENPVIKMSGKVDVVLTDPKDDLNIPDFFFGFIQVATVFQLEQTSVGRTINEGHLKINFRPRITQSFLLDSVAAFTPLASRVGPISKDPQNRKVHLGADLGILLPSTPGDSPGTALAARTDNQKTNAPNFMFEHRVDFGLTTVLVGIDPQKNVTPFFHVNWKLLWHFQFKWKGGQDPVATPIPISARADVSQPIKGGPTDPAAAALVARPSGAFFNDALNQALGTSTANAGPTIREDNFSRPSGIPQDFFT